MPSNQELINENKTLKHQITELEKHLKADVVQKSDYDKLKVRLDDAEKKLADVSFPTLQKDVEALNQKLADVTLERDQARAEVISAGNAIRNLQATQRVDAEAPETEAHAGIQISKEDLRLLTAQCLTKATDDMGRVIPEKQLDREVPKLVKVAVYIAKEIAAQIP